GAGTGDVQRGEAGVVGPLPHASVDLGRQHDVVATSAALGQPPPDDLLGDALARLPPVDVRRVEEIDAQLEGLVHDRAAVGLAGEGAEVHGAETEPAHPDSGATELHVLHAFL